MVANGGLSFLVLLSGVRVLTRYILLKATPSGTGVVATRVAAEDKCPRSYVRLALLCTRRDKSKPTPNRGCIVEEPED